MTTLSKLDLSILKYYKEGHELSGFENGYDNLYKLGYLDGDLALTHKGYKFIKEFKNWDSVKIFNNEIVVTIKPKL